MWKLQDCVGIQHVNEKFFIRDTCDIFNIHQIMEKDFEIVKRYV